MFSHEAFARNERQPISDHDPGEPANLHGQVDAQMKENKQNDGCDTKDRHAGKKQQDGRETLKINGQACQNHKHVGKF